MPVRFRAIVANMAANIEDQPERIQALIAAYDLLAPYIDQLRQPEPASEAPEGE
jgi:hypothetical protein